MRNMLYWNDIIHCTHTFIRTPTMVCYKRGFCFECTAHSMRESVALKGKIYVSLCFMCESSSDPFVCMCDVRVYLGATAMIQRASDECLRVSLCHLLLLRSLYFCIHNVCIPYAEASKKLVQFTVPTVFFVILFQHQQQKQQQQLMSFCLSSLIVCHALWYLFIWNFRCATEYYTA